MALIAFTLNGARLAVILAAGLSNLKHQCRVFASSGPAEELRLPSFTKLRDWTGQAFAQEEGIIFVGACGIAVRAIAPWVHDKYHDPAVVVVDECAQFAIALLSGHVGGANQLTRQIATVLGATPVITTATDCHGVIAIDQWATNQGMIILEKELIKKIAVQLLKGQNIGLASDFPVISELPSGVVMESQTPVVLGMAVTLQDTIRPFGETLHLLPVILTVGIGCRKGTSAEAINKAVQTVLMKNKLSSLCIKQICSIDLKAEEPGLLAYCEQQKVPLRTFSADELQTAAGDFCESEFVQQVTGVNNVCERAALIGSGGKLLVKKQVIEHVTVAVASAIYELSFF